MTLDEKITEERSSLAPAGGARVFLVAYHRNGAQVVPLPLGESLTVGRTKDADVRLRDRTLSRRHARFSYLDGIVWVEDLGSTNGTTVNDVPITRRVPIGERDSVGLGSVSLSLHDPPRRSADSGEGHNIEGHDRFVVRLEEELARSKYFSRKVGLVMIHAREGASALVRLVSQHDLYGHGPLRPMDRLAMYSADTVEIVLPEIRAEEVLETARAIVDAARDVGGLACGVAVYPDDATSAEELIESCRIGAQHSQRGEPVRLGAAEQQRPARAPGDAVVASAAMRDLYKTVDTVASAHLPVLITGETGTGKEVLARAIHQRSGRRARPMICINCGAIPSQLIESVLFGHERGAFTGATQRAKGVFEQADGGTVLLDEIGELSAEAQAALLRVLETKRITRIGSTREIDVDVRIVAATHRDLELMCEEERFRWDLFFRLNVMPLTLPPLRERREDIAPLCEHFIALANEASGRRIRGVDDDALALLSSYDWPGNVRELRNVIERAVVIAQTETIAVEDLSARVLDRVRPRSGGDASAEGGLDDFDTQVQLLDDLPQLASRTGAATLELPPARPTASRRALEPPPTRASARPPARPPARPAGATPAAPSAAMASSRAFRERVQRFEATLIFEALLACDGNQSAAARWLQMPLRSLVRKVKDYEIGPMGFFGEEHPPPPPRAAPELDFRSRVRLLERDLIAAALEQHDTQAAAARALQIPMRTMVEKIKKYRIEPT